MRYRKNKNHTKKMILSMTNKWHENVWRSDLQEVVNVRRLFLRYKSSTLTAVGLFLSFFADFFLLLSWSSVLKQDEGFSIYFGFYSIMIM